jgi:hypothetical protein
MGGSICNEVSVITFTVISIISAEESFWMKST